MPRLSREEAEVKDATDARPNPDAGSTEADREAYAVNIDDRVKRLRAALRSQRTADVEDKDAGNPGRWGQWVNWVSWTKIA